MTAPSQSSYILRPSIVAPSHSIISLKRDLGDGLNLYELWLYLGWRDVKKLYRRSAIGPLWLTLSMGIMVLALGILYSKIFNVNIENYIPFLAAGMIIWGFISSILNFSCNIIINATHFIKQIRLPFSVYIFQFIWSQIIIFVHNFVIYIFVIIYFRLNPGWHFLEVFPAIFLVILSGFFCSIVLGPLCARFRDIPMIITNIVQLIFFVTPILWNADTIKGRAYLVNFNPFFHFIELVRNPMLGHSVPLQSWLSCIAITGILGVLSMIFLARYRSRIVYWV